MKGIVLATLGLGLLACGHAPAPAVAVDLARGLRNLTADSDGVLPIAMEAAREITPSAQANKALFGGVYVSGRKARKTTDEVVHANGFAAAPADKAPAMKCVARSPDGRQIPIQCPRVAVESIPPVFTFDDVVATSDSAYVAVSEATIDSRKASCITLHRAKMSWSVVSNVPIGDVKKCGR
jgi:hypothetical protein